jgi:tRNA(Arg) A34 adenosine deaminase TadA
MKVKRRNWQDNTSRDDYWIAQALWVASGAKTTRPAGAIIVDTANSLLATGTSGNTQSNHDTNFIFHAEKVAIFNLVENGAGATMYVTHTPCPHCMMDIVLSGIRRVIYLPSELEPQSMEVARSFYVQLEEFKGNLNWMRDYMKVLEGMGLFS